MVSKVANQALKEGLDTVKNPQKARALAQKGAEGAQAAGRVLRQSPDPKTIFKGKLSPTKKVAWSKPIPLRDIKTIKNALNSGVNEVLTTAVSGALRHYMNDHGQFTSQNIRAVMPMNMRSSKEMGKLGNKFGFVFVPLPIGEEEIKARLDSVTADMAALKNSDETVATFGIQKGIEFTPHDIQAQLVKQFGGRATAVMSNIPGPPMPLYMAGSKVSELMFWMPHTGDLGLGISMLSYAQQVYFGVSVDNNLVADPSEIIDGIYAEIDALLALSTQPAPKPDPVPAVEEVEEEIDEEEIVVVVEQETAVSEPDDLTAIKGVGSALAAKLQAAGFTTIAEIGAAELTAVAQAIGGSEARAQKIIDAAR
jgi:WS/DGAT/MGAT family acyltransferase